MYNQYPIQLTNLDVSYALYHKHFKVYPGQQPHCGTASAGVSQYDTYFQLSRGPCAALSGSVDVCVAPRHIRSEQTSSVALRDCLGRCVAVRHVFSTESTPMCRTLGQRRRIPRHICSQLTFVCRTAGLPRRVCRSATRIFS